MPSDANIVRVGSVLFDVALPLRLVRAVGLLALTPSYANVVHHVSLLLDVGRLRRLVLAFKLSASVPSDADVMQEGSVQLDIAALCEQLCSRHSCQVTPMSCKLALCFSILLFSFALYWLPSSGQSCHTMSMLLQRSSMIRPVHPPTHPPTDPARPPCPPPARLLDLLLLPP